LQYIDVTTVMVLLLFLLLGCFAGFRIRFITWQLTSIFNLAVSALTSIACAALTTPAFKFARIAISKGTEWHTQIIRTFVLASIIGMLLFFVLHKLSEGLVHLVNSALQPLKKLIGQGILNRIVGALCGLISGELFIVIVLTIGLMVLDFVDKSLYQQTMTNSNIASFVAVNFTDKLNSLPISDYLAKMYLSK